MYLLCFKNPPNSSLPLVLSAFLCTLLLMDAGLIIDNIQKHVTLSEEEKSYFLSLLEPNSLQRKHFLLLPNHVANHAAFVTKGCLRSYNIDKEGVEHVLQFAPPDWWITDMSSLVTREPGMLFIDAIENSEMWLLSREKQLLLLEKYPVFEKYFRIITEKSLVSTRSRLLDSLSLTAKERYLRFCRYYPTLIHTLPQKQIAAYIGVTPEFFSKMRADFR